MRRDKIDDPSESFHLDAEFLGGHFAAVAGHDVLSAVADRRAIRLGDCDQDVGFGLFPVVDSGVEEDALWVAFFGDAAEDGFEAQQG